MLPLIVLVVTVTVLVPAMYIPPPCKGIDAFSSFTALHWGDGVDLSPGEHSHTAGKVRGSTTSSKEGGRGVGQAFRKASTFGRFQNLRSAHIVHSVACDAAALGVQSPSIHVDSTSLKPSELTFGTHETKLHWGHGRRSEKVGITGIQKSEHFWEVSNFAECSHRP